MKRGRLLIVFFLFFSFTMFFLFYTKDKITLFYSEDTLYIELSINNQKQIITPLYDEENKYIFFLPSYAKECSLFHNLDNKTLFFDKTPIYDSSFHYIEDSPYIIKDNTTQNEVQINFLTSDNIPSMFLTLDNGELSQIHSDKNAYFPADIKIINSQGNLEYNGTLKRLSGRGNSSYSYEKKPYSIRFYNPTSLLGLEPSSKWVLLANWRDVSKLQNKITFDIANFCNMSYTPRSAWLDLYVNGDYVGNYLLCSPVSIDEYNMNLYDLEEENLALNPDTSSAISFNDNNKKGFYLQNPSNITGAYLIEKDYHDYYCNALSGFSTNSGCEFSIKSPSYTSKEQVDYIYNYVQNIETMIMSQDKDLTSYFDIDGYSKHFLIDQISLNFDTGVTSLFFYKNRNDNKLYSGPVWDYDYAYGIPAFSSRNKKWVDYTTDLLDTELTWNKHLYNNPIFYSQLIRNFEAILPQLESLITYQIDDYVNTISKSVYLDKIRWEKYSKINNSYYYGHYYSAENNIEYLKYFLTNRINYLIDKWDISYPHLTLPETNEYHTVTFLSNDTIIEERQIKHGENITSLPTLNNTTQTWYMYPRKEIYSPYLPILEDTIFTTSQ